VLGLQEQPDAVENPWRLIVAEVDLAPRLLPAGTRMTQVYDEADGEVLILGEPGAGKTTLLLELACDLLLRAEEDGSYPLPVIFHLSSWAIKQQPLAQWLAEELSTKYRVPLKIGKAWTESTSLLILLDGLDEVAEEARSACVKAINAYQQAHGFVPMVVCCRTAEYFAQGTRVAFQRAVLVQPLTVQQIDEYLSRIDGKLEEVRKALDVERW
jgi:predicted NACHT family NTPase